MFGITQAGQLTLEELIEWLKEQDPDATVRNGFGEPHSDRGDYSELAFDPVKNTTFGEMLAYAESADGATFYGWKGGEYTMDLSTPVHIGWSGESGEPISRLTLQTWVDKEKDQLAEDKRELMEAMKEISTRSDGAGWLASTTLDKIKAREEENG